MNIFSRRLGFDKACMRKEGSFRLDNSGKVFSVTIDNAEYCRGDLVKYANEGCSYVISAIHNNGTRKIFDLKSRGGSEICNVSVDEIKLL